MKNPRSLRSRALLIVVNLLSLGLLVFALRGSHLGELGSDLLSMNWWWVGLAVLGDLSVYLVHGSRWQILLRPVVPLKYWETVRAIYVGLFANEVIPLRAGELVRCYTLSRDPRLPLSVALTSALIERVFDGIWLCILLLLMLRFVPLPPDLHFVVTGGYILAGAVLMVAAVLSVLLFRRHQSRRLEVPHHGGHHPGVYRYRPRTLTTSG